MGPPGFGSPQRATGNHLGHFQHTAQCQGFDPLPVEALNRVCHPELLLAHRLNHPDDLEQFLLLSDNANVAPHQFLKLHPQGNGAFPFGGIQQRENPSPLIFNAFWIDCNELRLSRVLSGIPPSPASRDQTGAEGVARKPIRSVDSCSGLSPGKEPLHPGISPLVYANPPHEVVDRGGNLNRHLRDVDSILSRINPRPLPVPPHDPVNLSFDDVSG